MKLNKAEREEYEAAIIKLSKTLLKYMGHKPDNTHGYEGIRIRLNKEKGVTPEMIEYAITSIGASGYAKEQRGVGKQVNELGQMLTAKGRRAASKLRGKGNE